MQAETPTRPEPVTQNDVLLRPLVEDDIPPLAHAIGDVSQAQIDWRWREQQMRYREVLVADMGGEPVGTVSIGVTSREPDSLHLFALEVARDQRGSGIGTAIIQHVMDEARRRGLRRVHLEVRTDNPARRLYHRLGFRRIGGAFVNSWWMFHDDGTQDRMDELSYRMVKRLKP